MVAEHFVWPPDSLRSRFGVSATAGLFFISGSRLGLGFISRCQDIFIQVWCCDPSQGIEFD
jgi:hypothetical protein